jgi:hypothetical protein
MIIPKRSKTLHYYLMETKRLIGGQVSEGQASFANENAKSQKQRMEQANNKRHARGVVCFEFQ